MYLPHHFGKDSSDCGTFESNSTLCRHSKSCSGIDGRGSRPENAVQVQYIKCVFLTIDFDILVNIFRF